MLKRMITRAIRRAQYRAGAPGARAGNDGAGLRRERRTAAAGRLGVRIVEAETGAVQPVGEVERRLVEEQVAFAVDENADALLLVDLVALGGLLLERQLVGHPGA